MAKRRTHEEIERLVQQKLRKAFLFGLLTGTIIIVAVVLFRVRISKETDLFFLLLLSALFAGLPLALCLFWATKWSILGYNSKIESVIFAILLGIHAIVSCFNNGRTTFAGIIWIGFTVEFVANLVHSASYKRDIIAGTIPDIDINALEGKAKSGRIIESRSEENNYCDVDEEASGDEYDDEEIL